MDIPRSFVIRESGSRILDPLDAHKLDVLGRALRLPAGSTVLDLCCGKGEMLGTWARDLGFTGHGVDLSSAFVAAAEARSVELGVADRVTFEHRDAAGYVAADPVDVAACLGASWIGGDAWPDRISGTLSLLGRSVRPGGLVLIGEPYWRRTPPDEETVAACHARGRDEFPTLPALLDRFDELGHDLVETVLADPDSWDRYVAPQWLAIRRFLDAQPADAQPAHAQPAHELADDLREELRTAPRRHLLGQREYLGWGVFVLVRR